jgi:prepilin-type processing-associated H-X9-DG protein
MHSPLRRLALCVPFLALVALVPACGKKNTGTTNPNPGPPPGPTGDERPPVKPGSDSTSAASPPIVIAAGSPRAAAARANSEGNLKQIALAFANFESTFGSFPAGIYDKAGQKMNLSWRVAILPFVEQQALYQQFKFDEPWDSDNNKRLIEKMPKMYAVQGTEPTDGKTYYRGFTGRGTVLDPQPGRPGGAPGNPNNAFGLKLLQITDGTSNTLAVAEARDPVIWTKPDELVYDPNKPVPKLGGVFGTGFNAAFCDGSVKYLPTTTDEKILRALITANGGETIQLP